MVIGQKAALIEKLPAGTVVRISGSTDSTGNPTANMKLSQQRAHAVRQVLIDAGISPAKLNAQGYGIYHSAASENATETKEDHSIAMMKGTQPADRRVEFHIAQS